MPLKVGELYATLKMDDRDFNQALSRSGKGFSTLKSTIASGTQIAATAFTATTLAVVGLGSAALKVGLDYNRMQQSSRAALTTLLGSAEAANAQMDKLDEFARKSPFAKQVFIQAQQQLLGFGMTAEDVIPTLDAIQNAVAAVGGSNEQVASVTYALAQMQGQGKLTGETLNQLGQYGIDAAGILGKEWGKTGAEIREMASKPGGIPADEVFKPLTEGLMKRFGGATDNIKQQFDGAADRIKGAFRDIGSALAAPFIDPKGGGAAVEWTNKFADAMRAAEAKVKPLVSLLQERFQPTLDRVSPALDTVKGAINSWDLSKVNGQLDELTKYTPLIAGVGTALFTMGAGTIPVLGALVPSISPVVAGFAALAATSPELRGAFADLGTTLQPMVPILGQLGIVLADTLMYAIKELGPAAGELAVAFASAGVNVASSLAPALLATVSAAEPVVDVIGKLAGFVADLPAPVLAAGLAFLAMRNHVGPLVISLTKAGVAMRGFADHAKLQAHLGGTNKAIGALSVVSMTARGSFQKLGASMLTAFGGPVGLAITGITMALGAFITSQANAKAAADAYKVTLDELGDQTEATAKKINETFSEKSFSAWDGLNVQGKSVIELMKQMGVSADDARGYIEGNADSIERVKAATDAYIDSGNLLSDITGMNSSQVAVLTEFLDKESEALKRAQDETRTKTDLDRSAGVAQDGAAASTRSHTDAIRAQMDLQKEAINTKLSAAEATLRAKDAQDRAADSVRNLTDLQKSGKATEQELTIAKREAESAVLSSVRAYHDEIAAMERNAASAEQLDAVIQKQRDTFIRQQVAMGLSAEAAAELADSYGLIPNKVATNFTLYGASGALSMAETLAGTLNRINGKTYTASVAIKQFGQAAVANGGFMQGGQLQKFDNGGFSRLPSNAVIQGSQRNLVQWAEPETFGEAFIPLAPAKRARSLAIWEETGRRLGAFAVKSFAQGGLHQANAQVSPSGGVGRSLTDADVAAIADAVRSGARQGASEGTSAGLAGAGGAARHFARAL